MRKSFALFLVALLFSFANAQIIPGNFVHDSINRVYDLYLPSGFSTTDTLPLLLDFHFLGADGRDEDSLTDFNPIADAERFVVCHPWGFFSDWNVGQNAPYSYGTEDVGFIDELIDRMHTLYHIDLDRVYAVGMGQGGFMVHRLACELSGKIAAIATVGASIADSAAYYCASARPVPAMMINGTADSVVPYYTGLPPFWGPIPDLVDFWKTRNNCTGNEILDSLPDVVNEGSWIYTHRWSCDQSSEVLHYEVRNGGFAWPGATRDLGSGGNRNMDISASQHIWDFLGRYGLTGIVGMAESVEEVDQVKVFPNPATDWVEVEWNGEEMPEIRLLSLQGIPINAKLQRISAHRIRISVENLMRGGYYLQIPKKGSKIVVKM
jgi:polyhydroxybutyrate depolymerase